MTVPARGETPAGTVMGKGIGIGTSKGMDVGMGMDISVGVHTDRCVR
ncbi:hypothetical protein OG895_44585 [Streptomyces sp. NBC_00201]|nr:hypothetical protein [Streptomyces sp. NBC_00201]MCX5252116.1 hypothetical protein [Streptomyces sp. NBC_00201]